MSRHKKYKMKAIPYAISEKGGFTAQFVSDGYSVYARKEILPGVIKKNGVQVGEGVAWDLIQSFLMDCAAHAAATCESVTVGSMITFGLSIRGWFENKDSKASKDNVRVTATLLNDLRPTVVFSMSNENDGVSLVLVTVMSDGCALGHIKQAAKFRINGKHLQLLEGDRVVASAKNAEGETVEAECAVIDSAEDHIDATLPGVFGNVHFVGREITLTVEGRCGDPDAGTQKKSITAILDKGDADAPEIAEAYSSGMESDPEHVYVKNDWDYVMNGANLANASVAIATTKEDGSALEVKVPADKVTATETKLTINGPWLTETMTDVSSDDVEVTFTITPPGGTATHKTTTGIA